MSDKIVVLLSGGLDSTTCLGLAREICNPEDVIALTVSYGQKHIKELQCARNVAQYYRVRHELIDLEPIFKYSDCPLLKHSSKEILHESYADQLNAMGGKGTVDTYVPFRNGLMLSAAATFALSVGATYIYYGAHADDAAGSAYPDCTPKFAEYIHNAIHEGSGHKLSVVTPFLYITKADIVKKGTKINVPYDLTWSCYEGGDKPCGKCGTCIDRIKAFELNGLVDPLLEV